MSVDSIENLDSYTYTDYSGIILLYTALNFGSRLIVVRWGFLQFLQCVSYKYSH